jgi:plastocyanin
MSRVSILIGAAGVAMIVVATLIMGGDLSSHPATSAEAPTAHAMMDHRAQQPAMRLAATTPNTVVIDDFTYGPATLTVAAGTKVVWTNDDADPHTVTSETDPKLLKSPPLDTGESFAFTFEKPGTYRYFCSLHPHMQGVIVVQ